MMAERSAGGGRPQPAAPEGQQRVAAADDNGGRRVSVAGMGVLPFRACLDPGQHPGLHVVVQRVGDEEVEPAQGQVHAGNVQDGEPQ